MPHRKYLKAVAAGLGALGFAITLNLTFPHRNFEVEPDRYRMLDDTLWGGLRWPFGGVLGLCGGKDKESDGWQWYKEELNPSLKGVSVSGDPNAFVRSDLINTLRVSCGGWSTVVLIEPIHKDSNTPYQIAYRGINDKTGTVEKNSRILTGSVYLMRGRGSMEVYASRFPDKSPVDLAVAGTFSRWSKPTPDPLV